MARRPSKPARGAGRTKSARPPVATAARDPGPLTLAEAKALAAVQMPTAPPRARAAAAPVPADLPHDPAAVGRERQRLDRAREEERARRVEEYVRVMRLMKERGARRPEAAKARARAATARSFQPLQIVAEGDSWFDYPVPFFGGGIVPRLENRLGVPILNLADAGDEVRAILGVEQRQKIIETLSAGSPAGGPWDAMLFSGGGNDVVGDPLVIWVKDWNPALPPAKHIEQSRYDAALGLVRAGYRELIALRNRLSPTTHLFFHAYDFAIPDGRGVCTYGPWLAPSFTARGFPVSPSFAERRAVVKEMLKQFNTMLQALTGPRVTLVKTQGTLPESTASWHNELHPGRDGFEAFAGKFRDAVKAKFPGRVV